MKFGLYSAGDATGLMERLPGGSIDMIISDPPYNMSRGKVTDILFDLDGFFKEAQRVLSDRGVMCLFSKSPLSHMLACRVPDFYRYEWVIARSGITGRPNSSKMPCLYHESLLVFYKRLPYFCPPDKGDGFSFKSGVPYAVYEPAAEVPGKNVADTIRFNDEPGPDGARPLSVWGYFIKTYTDTSMTILDPFMGSGDSGRACRSLSDGARNYIGFFQGEEDPFRDAVDRVCRHGG